MGNVDGENGDIFKELASVVRLASSNSQDDLRLFVAKLIRKYRNTYPNLSHELDVALKQTQTRSVGESVMRNASENTSAAEDLPFDLDSKMSLVKVFNDTNQLEAPILSAELFDQINRVVQEQKQSEKLISRGLNPTGSAIFVGPPGVGKTLSARWVASMLGKKLWVLDLSSTMSSFLGKTGSNIRSVLDAAKAANAILLLDEIDAVAKSRNDESDVGELKRLVTVILQELDQWPSTSLLLAATNHPEIIDSALWRRFDLVLNFPINEAKNVEKAVVQFLADDFKFFANFLGLISLELRGKSISDASKFVSILRRKHVLYPEMTADEIVKTSAKFNFKNLSKPEKVKFAKILDEDYGYNYSQISEITGLARDTIRKNFGPSLKLGKGAING